MNSFNLLEDPEVYETSKFKFINASHSSPSYWSTDSVSQENSDYDRQTLFLVKNSVGLPQLSILCITFPWGGWKAADVGPQVRIKAQTASALESPNFQVGRGHLSPLSLYWSWFFKEIELIRSLSLSFLLNFHSEFI